MISMAAMSKAQRSYLPAAGRDLFLPVYDLTAAVLGADRARQVLLDQMHFRGEKHVLDIGCGTGTFAVLLKRHFPAAEIIGLDPDPKALARAKRKAEQAGVSLRFDHGFADALEYPAETFDTVFSSFMFHHLDSNNKEKTLREVVRVLKPGGTFYLLDFETSESGSGHGFFRLFHANERMWGNSESRILALMDKAGFADHKKMGTRPVLFGLARAAYFRAIAPVVGTGQV